ncbi:hypothetical protein [Micromonospora violae]|uniref:hypothetical protein n=1 Tax=Micromonospora violae TaxID=1278207 RepID=UPI0033C97242
MALPVGSTIAAAVRIPVAAQLTDGLDVERLASHLGEVGGYSISFPSCQRVRALLLPSRAAGTNHKINSRRGSDRHHHE